MRFTVNPDRVAGITALVVAAIAPLIPPKPETVVTWPKKRFAITE